MLKTILKSDVLKSDVLKSDVLKSDVLKSDVLKSDVCKYKSGLLKTIVTFCLKACKTNDILGVRSNSAFIISIYNYLLVKKLNIDKLAL
jgi:hypothetical protein